MKTIITLLTLLFGVHLVMAQTKILDSLTLEPISGVNIYSDKGELLAISDNEGQLNLNSVGNIETKKLSLQHIGYQNKEMSYLVFKKSDKILLLPREFEIEGVDVTSQNNSDYVVLKGYFRTHDMFNNKSRYFYDGLITYYIPLKNTKEKVRRQLQAYRIYANQACQSEYIDLFGKAFSDPPKLLRIEQKSILESLPNGSILMDNGDKKTIMRNGHNLGFVQKSGGGDVQVYFDEVPPNTIIARSFFRIKGQQYRGITMANYGSTGLEKLPIEDLLSKTVTNTGAVQRKKKDGFTPIATFSEFYVIERSFLMAAEVEALEHTFQKSIYLEEKSHYTDRFWLNLYRYEIPPLANGISKQLGRELKEL